MGKNNKSIIIDQESFFNQHSLYKKVLNQADIFYEYCNKKQINAFCWLSDRKNILDYGCGTGTSLDQFFADKKQENYEIYGIDIAGMAIEKAKERYPKFKFYKISNNKIPQIKNNSLEGAYMLHILHHSHNHLDIFGEVYSKLKHKGKFFLSDLSSNNPIIKLGRFLFLYLPDHFKNRFSSDDFVVEGKIPEKYKVNIKEVVDQLKSVGFSIEEISYGHLFFFIFAWLDRFMPLSKFRMISSIYYNLMSLEDHLLKYNFFRKRAEVFYIKCVKK